MNDSSLMPWVHLERDNSEIGFHFTFSAEEGERTEDTVMWINTGLLSSQFLALSVEDQTVELLSFSRKAFEVVMEMFGEDDSLGHNHGGMLN